MRVYISLALLIGLSTHVCSKEVESDGPEAVVRAVIGKDRNAKLILQLPDKPNEYMRHTFTQAFNASWSNAMVHSKDEPVIDGDIITGRQTVTRVAIKSAATAENGDFAMVSTSVSYLNEDGPKRPHSEVVRFFLRKENGIWKIDDINPGDIDSVRTMFRKNYGK